MGCLTETWILSLCNCLIYYVRFHQTYQLCTVHILTWVIVSVVTFYSTAGSVCGQDYPPTLQGNLLQLKWQSMLCTSIPSFALFPLQGSPGILNKDGSRHLKVGGWRVSQGGWNFFSRSSLGAAARHLDRVGSSSIDLRKSAAGQFFLEFTIHMTIETTDFWVFLWWFG